MRPKFSVTLMLLAATLFPSFGAERPGRKLTTIQRMERVHLQTMRDARLKWGEARKNPPPPGTRRADTGIYNDYRAVIHVHAEDSNHTGGKRPEVLAAAKKVGVDVVMFTDHRGPKADTW